MSKVFVDLGITLDGFVAGTNRGPDNPLGDGGATIHEWLYPLRAFRRHLSLGDDGDTGPDNLLVEQLIGRIGANIMGKCMFDEGAANWPEQAPFHCPVFVLTKEKCAPWSRPGGTTFYFVNESLERVLARAREVAGDKDVRISGGRDVVVQYLNAGLVDELSLSLTPKLLGKGLRLFDGIDPDRVSLAITGASHSAVVTHLRYAVGKPVK